MLGARFDRLRREIPERFLGGLESVGEQALVSELLEQQARLMLRDELRFFHNDPSWLASKSVLEIGFGREAPIGSLRGRFPLKGFAQATLPADYFHKAGHSPALKESAFGLLDGTRPLPEGRFDYLIWRLVAQHLPDPGALLGRMRARLAPGGRFLIIDVDDALARFIPPVPSLDELYRQLGRFETLAEGRRRGPEALERAAREAGWEVERSDKIPMCAITAEDKETFASVFLIICELMRRLFGVSLDKDLMRREFGAWLSDPGCYGQIGLHFLLLKERL
jgi:SAM-dependent methyltransferase